MLKKPFWIIGLMGFISATSIFAQEKKVIPPSPVISTTLYGFVRNDFFFDTRQNVFVREGQLNLYPKD